MKPIHAFRVGVHRNLAGQTAEFGEDYIRQAAEAYDPAIHEAPIVIGHPKLDAPAWGWIGKAIAKGGELLLEPSSVVDEFAEWVRKGLFKKVSVSFYKPEHSPVPGVPYIKHLGFLGATPPSVKGLQPVEFGEEAHAVTVEVDAVDFAEAGALAVAVARLFRGLRDWLIDRDGLDTANQVVPDFWVEELERQAREQDVAATYSEPAEEPQQPESPDQIEMDADQFAQQQQQLQDDQARLEADRAAFEAEKARKRHDDFAETLISQGKLLPAQKATVVETLVQIDQADVAVSFGEGDAAEQKPVADAFRAFLDSLPKQVEFAELAKPAGDEKVTDDFAAPQGFKVSGDRLALHNKAVAYQRQHADVTYVDAVKAVGG